MGLLVTRLLRAEQSHAFPFAAQRSGPGSDESSDGCGDPGRLVTPDELVGVEFVEAAFHLLDAVEEQVPVDADLAADDVLEVEESGFGGTGPAVGLGLQSVELQADSVGGGHRWVEGEAAIDAFLDDYAYLADGLLDLSEATGEPRWRNDAEALATEMLVGFWDDEDGGFFFTSEIHETLLARSKDLFDGALPAPSGVAARVLARLGGEHAERADELLRTFGGVLARVPHGTLTLIEVGLLLSPSLQPESRVTEVSSGASAWEETFALTVPSGWHIENLTARAESDLKLGPVRLPEDRVGNELPLVAPVALNPKLAPGEYALTIMARFSPCNTRECLPIRELTARKIVRVV